MYSVDTARWGLTLPLQRLSTCTFYCNSHIRKLHTSFKSHDLLTISQVNCPSIQRPAVPYAFCGPPQRSTHPNPFYGWRLPFTARATVPILTAHEQRSVYVDPLYVESQSDQERRQPGGKHGAPRFRHSLSRSLTKACPGRLTSLRPYATCPSQHLGAELPSSDS